MVTWVGLGLVKDHTIWGRDSGMFYLKTEKHKGIEDFKNVLRASVMSGGDM